MVNLSLIIYNFINPVIASSITFFFIFLLKDLLLLNFLFVNEVSLSLGYLFLLGIMVIISLMIPRTASVET